MVRSRGRTGRPWRRARALCLTRSTICWLCGHDGADEADHDPPLKVLEAMGLDPCDQRYLHPAHGSNGCPICGRKYNQIKGDRTGPTARPLPTSEVW